MSYLGQHLGNYLGHKTKIKEMITIPSYIYYTEEERKQAAQSDLRSFLLSQGECVKRSGSEYVWESSSGKVNIRDNLWYHHYEQVGGNAVDFVRKFYTHDYNEAMRLLLGNGAGQLIYTKNPAPKKPFELPKENDNMRRLFAYMLETRKIDRDVLTAFVHNKMIYESEKYHNAVFVGYDKDGIARHAHKRSTAAQSNFKCNAESSIPEYSFHWYAEPSYCSDNNYGNELYLFEAPIDMLSFISMNKENWRHKNYAASCSVSDRVLFQCLKDNPKIDTVYLCFDNDEPGQSADKRIAEKLYTHGINYEVLVPTNKDWNEDLIDFNESEELQCPTLHL